MDSKELLIVKGTEHLEEKLPLYKKLIEKCKLTDEKIQLLGQDYEESDHSLEDVSLNEYLLNSQLQEAIPIIQKDYKERLKGKIDLAERIVELEAKGR